MKYNVFFTLRGPARTLEAPNRDNPVECDNLASLLGILSQNLPSGLGVEVVGIRVEEVSDDDARAGA